MEYYPYPTEYWNNFSFVTTKRTGEEFEMKIVENEKEIISQKKELQKGFNRRI